MLAFPVGLLLIHLLHKKKAHLVLQIITVITFLIFTWARFIEPQIILVQNHQVSTINQSKVALIADLHLGVYKDEKFLERVVKKINQIPELDAVLIAGDFTFYPTKSQNLNDLFAPLADINIPVIAVLGNHDVEKPGPKLRNNLVSSLKANNVQILNNQITSIGELNILALGDHWAKEDDITLIQDLEQSQKNIILTHNPDTTTSYSEPTNFLTLTGHTHGGQIRIPFLYKKVIPTKANFDKGLHKTKNGPVFVTSGLGEVDLPMRFLVPPTIDVLNL
jgi:predicted MPP superfamily phosphohydrolase